MTLLSADGGAEQVQWKITYSDLGAELLNLGFERRTENGHVIYQEKANDARLVLLNMSPDLPVLARHYVSARIIVDGRGVADEKDFERAMRERGDLPAGIVTVV
jgi:hypothetical protein